MQHVLEPAAPADVREPRKDLIAREIPRFKLRIRQRVQRAVEAERCRQPVPVVRVKALVKQILRRTQLARADHGQQRFRKFRA